MKFKSLFGIAIGASLTVGQLMNSTSIINGGEIDKLDLELNPIGDITINQELEKIPTNVKQLLVDNDVEIQIQEGLKENFEEGVETYGVYYWDYNSIIVDDSKDSIEYALIHECGHALDDILNISAMEDIQYSYDENEIIYENEHFNMDVEEYVAQSIQEYYNENLNKDIVLYDTIENILNEI